MLALNVYPLDHWIMRDEFTEKIKRVIQDRAGNRCSNPDCRVLTSGPNAHPERSTKTGVAAHISAASPGGPRYNSHLTSEQRQSAENGVWLCQNCAHFVDTDYLNYSVEIPSCQTSCRLYFSTHLKVRGIKANERILYCRIQRTSA